MTARVSMLLKSRASLTCFRACFLPGRTKDLSAPRYVYTYVYIQGFLAQRCLSAPRYIYIYIYYTGVLISPYPDQEGNKLMFLSEWREFPSAPCIAGKKHLVTARVSMLLKSRASPDMLPNLFPSWSGKGLICTPVGTARNRPEQL